MNQQVQLYEIVLPQAPLGQVTPQTVQFVMGVIGAVWFGAFVLQQMVKMAKGEEVEKPPLI